MMSAPMVLKAKAATLWCQHASMVSDKPWQYVLIPHDAIDHSTSFASLIRLYEANPSS